MLWWWLWWTKDEFIRTLNQDPLIESLDNFHMRKENKVLLLLCCDIWNHLFQPQKIQRRAPTHFILSNFIATTYTLHNLHLSVFASPNTTPSFDNIKVKGRRCIGQWPRPALGIPQLMSCRLFTICTFLPEIINFLSLRLRDRKTYPLSCVWSLGLCKITKRWRNAN